MEQHAFGVSIQSFLEEVSTGKPLPGGGSVAAVVASLGCATATMAAAMALKRSTLSAGEHSVLEQHLRAIEESISSLDDLCKADEKSFENYLQALRHPHQSKGKQRSRDPIQSSIIAATEVPLTIAHECLKTLERVQDIATFVRPKFISDVSISALLLEAAGQSALLLVDANLYVIEDESFKTSAKSSQARLSRQLSALRAQIVAAIDEL